MTGRQVNSAEEVRRVVANCRYAPTGARGIGPMIPTQYGLHDMKEYVDTAREAIFVSVMIGTSRPNFLLPRTAVQERVKAGRGVGPQRRWARRRRSRRSVRSRDWTRSRWGRVI